MTNTTKTIMTAITLSVPITVIAVLMGMCLMIAFPIGGTTILDGKPSQSGLLGILMFIVRSLDPILTTMFRVIIDA